MLHLKNRPLINKLIIFFNSKVTKKFNNHLVYNTLRFLLMLIFTFCYQSAYSQKQGKQRIDSLLKEVKKPCADSNKLKIYNDLTGSYLGINDDSSFVFSEKTLALALVLKNKRYEGLSYMYQGIYYNSKFDFLKSLEFFDKSNAILSTLKSEKDKARLLNNLGNYYNSRNIQNKAYECYSKSMKIYNKLKLYGEAAVVIGNIGLIYQARSMFDSALYCFENANKVFLEYNDSSGIARMLDNSGNIFDIKGNFAEAMRRKFKALSIYAKMDNKAGMSKVYNNLAYSYLYATEAIDKPSTPDSLKNRTILLQKAKKFINQSIHFNSKYNYRGQLIYDYKILTDIEYEMGDYKSSLLTYNTYIHLKDSVFSAENDAKMNALDIRRAEQVKQKEIEIKNIQLANIKKERIYYILGIIGVLLFSWFLVRSINKQRKTNKLLFEEKQISDNLLLNILPQEVAEELKQKGFTTAKEFDNVTILFSDIVNFTQLSEQLGGEKLVSEINIYFSAFDELMTQIGLEKIKTIGDAYIAADGLGIDSSPEKVINAAFIMLQKVEQLKKERENLNFPWFDFRIGIHTGPVVAGVVGIKKFQYDIWGDTVNTAARMESSGESGKINISGATYELIKDKYKCQYRGKIEAKHKGAIDMYFVDGKLVN